MIVFLDLEEDTNVLRYQISEHTNINNKGSMFLIIVISRARQYLVKLGEARKDILGLFGVFVGPQTWVCRRYVLVCKNDEEGDKISEEEQESGVFMFIA